MGEIARHSKPSPDSPETIVREKETVEVSTEYVGMVRYVTIERYVRNEFGGYSHEQTGAGVIDRE